MAPATVDGVDVPTPVWAAVLVDRVVGVLAVFAGLAVAVLLALRNDVTAAGTDGPDTLLTVGVGLLVLAVGVGLLVCAPAFRRGSLPARRAAIALHALFLAPSLLSPRSSVSSLLVGVVSIALHLTPTARRWTALTSEDRHLIAAENRQIRRAKRRLTEEAPSLRDIHLLPRSDEGDEHRHT